MKKLIAILFLLSLVLLQASKTEGLDIKLISENKSISSGTSFTVGVHIHHHKGFHTYWKNPGIVGIPTSILWELPKGFTADAIEWPHPIVSSMAGHPCHGYERDVTLLVKINAPSSLTEQSVTLKAKINWMCCAKNCYPGNGEFSLSIPVTKESVLNFKNADLFAKARREIPKISENWEVSILSKPDEAQIQFHLKANKEGTPAPEYIFSEDGQLSSNKKQQFIKQQDGSYLMTIERARLSPKAQKQFSGVLMADKAYALFTTTYKN